MKYLYYIFRLFFRPKCDHKFKVIERGDISSYGNIVGRTYHLQCTKCGIVKVENLH